MADEWVTGLASIPKGLCGMACGAIGGRIYISHGASGGAVQTVCYEYDPVTDTWTQKASASVGRQAPGGAVVNDKLYSICGRLDSGATGAVEEYDPATNTWTSKASKPTTGYGATTFVINGLIYVIVGNSSALEVYDPSTDTWTSKASMPVTKKSESYGWGGAVEGKGYVVIFDNGNNPHTLEYDPETNTWTSKTVMPTPRFSGMGESSQVTYRGKVWCIGGYDGSQNRTENEAYDPATDTWSQHAAMPTARRAGGGAFINNEFYAVGGWTDTWTDVVEKYIAPKIPTVLSLEVTPL